VSADGSTKAILAALFANAGIATAKFIGAGLTGSSSMLAEGVHSVADTSNQGLLLLGKKTSRRSETRQHPFGYGRDRYFYSFIVALMLFSMGSLFALYEGVNKIMDPHALHGPMIAIVILLVAIALETYSFRTAIVESRELKGDASWWQFIRQSKVPELPVVLLEDAGALVGLIFALFGVSLTVVTGDAIWDGIGTVMIGVLLGVIAVVLIIEMKGLLIGEGSSDDELDLIVGELEQNPVQRVIHIRTQYIGPEELLVAAKLALTRGMSLPEIAGAIDDAEDRIRAKVPAARLIYLEPDLDRTPDVTASR